MRRYYVDFEKPIVELEDKLEELKKNPSAAQADIAAEIKFLEAEINKLKKEIFKRLTAWQRVQLARHPQRPRFSDYLSRIFTIFIELHGDRLNRDDPAIVGGLATLEDKKLVVVGTEKGKDTRDRIRRNFGMPHPQGYRKAVRLYKLAAKFNLPLITFIDTPGAFAGLDAEQNGQAWAIAECLKVLSNLPVPIISVNIGEGGSGGALALGVADKLLMLENSYYSVISPEGCAAILWQSKDKAAEAAELLKLTATDLFAFGLIDKVIKEPLGGAHRNPDSICHTVGKEILASLEELTSIPIKKLLKQREEKLNQIA